MLVRSLGLLLSAVQFRLQTGILMYLSVTGTPVDAHLCCSRFYWAASRFRDMDELKSFIWCSIGSTIGQWADHPPKKRTNEDIFGVRRPQAQL